MYALAEVAMILIMVTLRVAIENLKPVSNLCQFSENLGFDTSLASSKINR